MHPLKAKRRPAQTEPNGTIRAPVCASLCQNNPRNSTNLRLVQRLYQTVPFSDTCCAMC
jgi:hypothetical protein